MVFTVQIADRIVEIHTKYAQVENRCRNYLLDCNCDPDIKVDQSMLNPVSTRDDLLAAGLLGERFDLSDDNIEFHAIHRLIADAMFSYGTLLIHGAAIASDGYGYLITAASGVGKTTRCRLWIKHIPNSIVVNGDKPLVHVSEDSVTIYGTPWCGKENWNNNIAVPLRAIFILERAEKGEPDLIEELSSAQAILGIADQTYQPEGDDTLLRLMQLLRLVVKKVKCYRLRCAPTVEAVRVAWETARPKE